MKYLPLIITPLLLINSLATNAGLPRKEISNSIVTTVYASSISEVATEDQKQKGGLLSIALTQSLNKNKKLNTVLYETSKKVIQLSNNRQHPRIEGVIFDPNRLLCSKNNTYVVSIGINQYPKMNIHSLQLTEKDANTIAVAFKKTCGAVSTVLTNVKAQKNNILKVIQNIAQRAKKGDAVVVSYSGYGIRTRQGDVLLAYDTTRQNIDKSTITVKNIQHLLSRSNAKSLLVLDTYFENYQGSITR